MRRDQDYFNRLIVSEERRLRVRLRPRGSEFRDLTRGVEIVHWFTILPGLISILGWVLHHTLFRSRWLVTAEIDGPENVAPLLQLDPLPKHEAERAFLRLADWLYDGHSLEAFRTQSQDPTAAG